MDNTVQQEKSAQEQWNRQMLLLTQLSHRLLQEGFNDTFVAMAVRTQHVLKEMQRLAEDLPGFEPFGSGYRDAHAQLKSVLVQLEADLKTLTKAKEAGAVAAADAGWARILKQSSQR